MKLYMFRTVPMSIIRSIALYTQPCYTSYRFADSLRAGLGWISSSRYTKFSNLFWNETLYVSDSPSVHHQEYSTVHPAMVYVIQVCWQLASRIRNCRSILILLANCQHTCMTYTIAVCTVKNSWWSAEELSETCRVSFQNKSEKLVHIQGVTGGMCETSGECSLGQTIPI